MAKFTSDNAAAMGRRGGLATYEKHGRPHMQKIGKAGFQVVADKYHGGDRRKLMNTLIHKALMAIDPMPYNRAWTRDEVPDRLSDTFE